MRTNDSTKANKIEIAKDKRGSYGQDWTLGRVDIVCINIKIIKTKF